MTGIYTEFCNTLSRALIEGAVISAAGISPALYDNVECVMTVAASSEKLRHIAATTGITPGTPMPVFIHYMVPGKRSVNSEGELGIPNKLMERLSLHQPNLKLWRVWHLGCPYGEK